MRGVSLRAGPLRLSVVVVGAVRFGAGALSSSLVVVLTGSLPMLEACAKAPPLAVARIRAIMSLRMRAILGRAGNVDYSAISDWRHGRRPFGDNPGMPPPQSPVENDPARADAERRLLLRLSAGAVSGDQLAGELGLTRAAVWKRIDALRQAGIEVDAQPGRGYTLARPLDLLDEAQIRQDLSAEALSRLESLSVRWTLDSTNTALLAERPPQNGVRVLLAERQQGGRGRLGRPWASPLAANVYLSVDRQFEGGLARLSGLSLVAGIVAAEALREVTGLNIQLKWPNDLWLDGRKLGGLLVEGGGEHGGPARAVIGLGLNVRMPENVGRDIDQAWIDLAARCDPPSRNALVVALLSAWLPALEVFDREGLASFLPRWLALDALAGQRVRLINGDQVRDVEALGLADDGGLRVRDEQGERIVYSGEVSVRPA